MSEGEEVEEKEERREEDFGGGQAARGERRRVCNKTRFYSMFRSSLLFNSSEKLPSERHPHAVS